MTMISERVSGGPGPAGEWREAKFSSSQNSGVLSIAINGDTGTSRRRTARSRSPASSMVPRRSFQAGIDVGEACDPHTLKVTYKDDDGKVRRENTFALSEDGTTITETDVTPAPSPSK